MNKYTYGTARELDSLWYIGEKDCIEKAVSSILKLRTNYSKQLLSVFLDDITLFVDRCGEAIHNVSDVKKIYELKPVTGCGASKLEQLQDVLRKNGQVILITSTIGLPYKVHYDTLVFNPDSGLHAIAVVGYDKDDIHIMESEKYIGPDYQTLDDNPLIGVCNNEAVKICLDEHFECMDVICNLNDEESIKRYTGEIIRKVLEHKNLEDTTGFYGLAGIQMLKEQFYNNQIPITFYSDQNVMEITNLVKSRTVLQHYISEFSSEELPEIDSLFEEDIKYWTKFMRIIMRRHSNDTNRSYDNSDVCNLLDQLLHMEQSIYELFEQLYLQK